MTPDLCAKPNTTNEAVCCPVPYGIGRTEPTHPPNSKSFLEFEIRDRSNRKCCFRSSSIRQVIAKKPNLLHKHKSCTNYPRILEHTDTSTPQLSHNI